MLPSYIMWILSHCTHYNWWRADLPSFMLRIPLEYVYLTRLWFLSRSQSAWLLVAADISWLVTTFVTSNCARHQNNKWPSVLNASKPSSCCLSPPCLLLPVFSKPFITLMIPLTLCQHWFSNIWLNYLNLSTFTPSLVIVKSQSDLYFPPTYSSWVRSKCTGSTLCICFICTTSDSSFICQLTLWFNIPLWLTLTP